MNSMLRTSLACALVALAGAAKADITIGVSLSLTGPLSSLGLPVKASLPLWPNASAARRSG